MLESKLTRWKEELSVICIKVVVKGKGRDRSNERGGVHDEEYRAENRPLENTTRGSMQGREVVGHLTGKKRDDK